MSKDAITAVSSMHHLSGMYHRFEHCMPLAGHHKEGILNGSDWPDGCLGYAFNLVRPKHPGHRAGLLNSLLGSMLVFETQAQASAYRELITQVSLSIWLHTVCPVRQSTCCQSDNFGRC